MALPWRTFSAVSLITAYFVTAGYPSQWRILWFVTNFLAGWAVQLFGFVIWRVVLWPKLFSPLIGLPEPSGNSFFNGQWKIISEKTSGVPMMEWVNTIPHDGLIRYQGLFNIERVMPCSAKALGEVLVTKNYDFQKPSQMRWGLARILGIGLLLAEGEEHKFQRRNLLPAFAFRHVKDLYATFWKISREGVQVMTEQILADAAKGPVLDDEKLPENTAVTEVGNWASRMTLDIIGVAGLGRDFNAIHDPNNELNQTYRTLLAPNKQARILDILSIILPGWMVAKLPLKRNGTVSHAADFIRQTCRALIEEKKTKLAENKLHDLDILSVALESGAFTDENLVDQLMTFLAAGHETTASAMTWAIYMLCLHQDVQTRLRDEIRSHLPSLSEDTAEVTSQEIDHLPYLNAVCNEVLRYYPPAPLTIREAAVDTTICDHPIPKGTRVIIIPNAINRSKSLWGEDADKFNPDRWLPKFEGDKGAASGHATSNYAFLTFLHGPRSCIGQGFAKAEFACLLAAWVGRFQFEIRDKAELDEKNMVIKGGITMRPANGLWVKATVLDGW
ncbi:hypothetical protein DL546_000981 [Coniochaeta pulveracea]|uniref:Cytochrome P450-dit2 n=1 Tax=Coniochaeta pulveracea TaxID=177199 RepID=A0A420XWR0_9PEZI|nr:hypothetical protein DL546_000981 [Coniochaeta pulveracea]